MFIALLLADQKVDTNSVFVVCLISLSPTYLNFILHAKSLNALTLGIALQ